MNTIRPNQFWQFHGPTQHPSFSGQIHKVIFADSREIVTVGIPYGHGCGWLGGPALFIKHFAFRAEDEEGAAK